MKDLYRADQVEPEADLRQFLDQHSDDHLIEQAVEVARVVLEAAEYDLNKPPALLLGDTEEHLEAHQAARILYHAHQMARAMEQGRILDVRRHALRFATWLRDAEHTEAWGMAVLKHRNIRGPHRRYDQAKIRAIADAHRLPDGRISVAGRQQLEAIGVSPRHLRRLIWGEIDRT